MKFSFSNIFGKKPTAKSPVPEPPVEVPAPIKAVDSEEEETTYNKMEKVNIKALEGTQMKPGKVYAVSKESADFLTKNGRAVLAKDSEKLGKIYNYPKSEKKPDVTD